MGVNNLPDLASSPTLVPATTEQYNAVTDALQGHQVMRDSSGVIEDGVSTIGRPSSGRPDKIYVKTGINVDGKDINLDAIALESTGITSGKSKTSGFPNFLTPLGETGGATNTFLIEAETTNLVMTIDGESLTLAADLESDDLALAPSSNNTCEVDDLKITGDPEFSKTIGEYGYYINIDETGGIGSEITALDGTVQCFEISNGAETEVFIALVDTTNNKLIPIKRGVGGTDRIAFSDTDTITLLKVHYIFLDNDLTTIDTTTNYPIWSATAPGAPATGDYWWDVTNTTWKRYSGASWEALGRIYLGYAICDSADCLYVEHEDYNLGWNELLTGKNSYAYSGTQCIVEAPLNVNIAGTDIKITTNQILSLASDLASGEAVHGSGDRWYYIYITNTGVLYLSGKAPRKKDKRLGKYHPSEYWRCIGFCLFSSASVIDDFYYSYDAGTFGMPNKESAITAAGNSIYEAFFLDNDSCCPIIEVFEGACKKDSSANFDFRISRLGSLSGASKVYIIAMNSISTDWFSITVPFVSSGGFDITCASTNKIFRIVPRVFFVRF